MGQVRLHRCWADRIHRNIEFSQFASERLSIGLSPHSPYTVEPDALLRCVQVADERAMPLAIHLAETADEKQFIRTHAGPLQQIWDRMRLATTTFLTVSKSHHSLREIVDRHSAVLEALRTQDPDAAERTLRSHIEEPGQWLRAALEEEAAADEGKVTRKSRISRRR